MIPAFLESGSLIFLGLALCAQRAYSLHKKTNLKTLLHRTKSPLAKNVSSLVIIGGGGKTTIARELSNEKVLFVDLDEQIKHLSNDGEKMNFVDNFVKSQLRTGIKHICLLTSNRQLAKMCGAEVTFRTLLDPAKVIETSQNEELNDEEKLRIVTDACMNAYSMLEHKRNKTLFYSSHEELKELIKKLWKC